jgi:hypothetical protein
MRTTWGCTVAALALGLLVSATAAAQDEFRVNGDTNFDDKNAAAALDGAGRFVVVWQHKASPSEIWGRRFTAAGQPEGFEFRVDNDGYHHEFPDVARRAGGDFLVVWFSVNIDSNGGIAARRYAATGAPLGSEFRVNSYTTNTQYFPAAASLPDGYVVVWAGPGTGDTDGGIFAKRIAATGEPLTDDFRVNGTTTGNQGYKSAVASDSTGAFVIVWAYSAGVFGQRYAANGTPLGTEFRAAAIPINTQSRPAVAANQNGFVVTWQESRTGSADVWGQRWSASGAPLGTEFRVNSYTTNYQGLPAVASDGGGGFLVAWTSTGQDGDGKGVFGQRYTSAGVPSGAEFRVNSYTTLAQTRARVAQGGGRFVVAWQTQGLGIGYDVYARKIAVSANGDVNADGGVDVGDVFYLINTLFARGAPAVGPADVNGDGIVNVSDVFYLINYLFAGGAAPV